MADDNPLIEKMRQELRLNQKDGYLTFSKCLMELTKRFPGCVIQSSAFINAKIPFSDKYLIKIGFDPDHIDTDKQELANLVTPIPETFDKLAMLSLQEFIEVPDGWYWGTTVSGLPHGYGILLYRPDVNHHKEIILHTSRCDHNLNFHSYVMYEGCFEYGKLNGKGVLYLKGNCWYSGRVKRVLSGNFQDN